MMNLLLHTAANVRLSPGIPDPVRPARWRDLIACGWVRRSRSLLPKTIYECQ